MSAMDALEDRKNPDRFNEKFTIPLLRSLDTADSLKANLLRYSPDNHKSINSEQIAQWIHSKNTDLRSEAIWKSRFNKGEQIVNVLTKLALEKKAPNHDRLDAIAALGALSPIEDATNLIKHISLEKNPLLHAEAQRSLGQRKTLVVTDFPSHNDTASWLKKIEVLPGKANPDTGRRIFFNRKIATCGNCHQINDRGIRVGPDLTFIGRGMNKEKILESILDPNKEVSPYLRPWVITMDDETVKTGIAMRRGGNSEAYLGVDGKEFRVDKRKIKTKQELHTSLMPAGLAYTMSLEELRDLLAFLLQQR